MKTRLLLCAALVLVASFTACRDHRKSDAPAQYAIVLDASRSVLARCESLQGLAEKVLSDSSLSKHSTLTVLATGDRLSANEPRLLWRGEVPHTRRVLEGRSGAAKQLAAWLDDLREICESMPETDLSPVLLSVQRGLEQLRALGCKEGTECKLLVQTDLEENVDPVLAEALNPKYKIRPLSEPRLDNSGLAVNFCGQSETLGVDKRDNAKSGKPQRRLTSERVGARVDQLRTVWQSVFSDASSVIFEPFCAKPEIQTAGTARKSR